jgi:radical SAM superfamily enzyme YgiQ (UPF0313 family)
MYRKKEFRVRPVEAILEEIRGVASRVPRGVNRVFLADGDALAAPQEVLVAVLKEIRDRLPAMQRVGVYADSRSIIAKGAEDLTVLRDHGLGIVYFGAESGDQETLRAVRKGATVERQLEASKLVREAGIKLSIMVLLGLAGEDGSERHARASGRFLVDSSPNYGAALMVTPVPGTEMHDAISHGEFALPDKWGMLQELRWMLEEMDGYRGLFHANHASNYLPLKLRMPRDRQQALDLIDTVLERRDESYLRPEWARGL